MKVQKTIFLVLVILAVLPLTLVLVSKAFGVVIDEIRESNHTSSKVTISWITDTATTGSVNWGVSEGSLNNTANDDRGAGHSDDTHYVSITGLSASTTYYYKVVSGDATSSTDSFTTATVGTGNQHVLYGYIKKPDGVTVAEGAIVYVTVTSGGVTSQRLSDLTDSDGSWQVNLGNLKKSDGSVLGYNTGDAIHVFAQGAADGTSTYDDTVGTSKQRIPASGDLSLPVELSIFTATSIDNGVLLSWRTETEVNNVGFAIYRSEEKDGKYVKIAFIPGAGNSGIAKDYQFADEGVEPGKTYFYYLEDIDIAGNRNKSQIIKVVLQHDQTGQTIPREFRLLQNFPNPFNPETWLPYQLARSADVIIRIYNNKGELIRTINLWTKNAGVYTSKNKSAHWNGRSQTNEPASSGVYFYQIKAGNFIATRKMILLK